MLKEIAGVQLGCTSCMIATEIIIIKCNQCVNLITFVIYVWITIAAILGQTKCFSRFPERKLPVSSYIPLIILSFVVSVGNNLSLRFKITVPVLIIFRSGALFTQLVLQRILRKRYYSRCKVNSVLMITFGIALFTFADFSINRSPSLDTDDNFTPMNIPSFMIGVALLSFCLPASAYLGICQEDLYLKHGKHHEELMLYIHLLSLPGFIFLRSDIHNGFTQINDSERLVFGGFEIPFASLWIVVLILCLSQWMCVKSIYQLTSITTPLNVTLVTTLRKFISLSISVVAFKNSFSIVHFCGSIFVFLGTITYAYDGLSFIGKIRDRLFRSHQKAD